MHNQWYDISCAILYIIFQVNSYMDYIIFLDHVILNIALYVLKPKNFCTYCFSSIYMSYNI